MRGDVPLSTGKVGAALRRGRSSSTIELPTHVGGRTMLRISSFGAGGTISMRRSRTMGCNSWPRDGVRVDTGADNVAVTDADPVTDAVTDAGADAGC